MTGRLGYRIFTAAAMLLWSAVAALPDSARAQEHGFVGMQVQGVNEELVEALGLDEVVGALVRDISVGSPGEKAGFLRGDLILSVGDSEVAEFQDLLNAVVATRPGDKRQFTVLRRGETLKLNVRFSNWPPARQIQKEARGRYPVEGLSLAALTNEVREEFAVRWGVVGVLISALDPGKPAQIAGLEEGDVIVMANGRDVWRPEQVDQAFRDARKRGVERMLMLVENRFGFRFVLMPGGDVAEDEAYADGPGRIGLKMQTVDDTMAKSLMLRGQRGVVVTDIVLGSGAAKGGFQRGDIITTVNGRAVNNVAEVFDSIETERANSRVEVRVLRGDRRKTLKPRIESDDRPWYWQPEAKADFRAIGLSLAALSGEMRRTYGLRWGMTGLVITGIDEDSPTADAGLVPGDVVLQINQVPVTSPEEFEAELKKAVDAGRKNVLVLVETRSGYAPRVLPVLEKET
jgi:S1-C subfamily serine protease